MKKSFELPDDNLLSNFNELQVQSSVQSVDQLGHWGDMMNDSAEILLLSFLLEKFLFIQI